jgi:hypothetical protein
MRWISWAIVVISFPLGLGLAWYLRDGCDVDRAVPLAAAAQLAIALPASFVGGLLSGRSVGGALARTGGVLLVSALVTVTVLPTVPTRVDRVRALRTAESLEAVAGALDAWARSHDGAFPVAHDPGSLAAALGTAVPGTDAWGYPLEVDCDGRHCAVVSLGACGEPEFPTADAYPAGEVDDVHADLVVRDGRLLRRPASRAH